MGNLTALRELALLWLADEVDSALKAYRAEHKIDAKWEAHERVVVALTGGPEGETLIRRGARIAARSAGGELIAVHVSGQDGLSETHPGALSVQRYLAEKLGGTYQLVIGVKRRSRLAAALTGPGIGATVVRESGLIDVHMVTHSAAGGRFTLPRFVGGLTLKRRIAGFILALVGGPLVALPLVAFRSDDSITSDVLGFQLLVVIVALVGGIWPTLFAALLSGFTLDYFFVPPFYTVTVAKPSHLLALALYVINALLVSYVVDQAARRSRVALRAAAESELLATIAGSVLRGQDAVQALVTRTREAFSMREVRLVHDSEILYSSGESTEADQLTIVPTGERGSLELRGPDLRVSERRLLGVIATQIDAALEHNSLSKTTDEVGPLAETDRMRSALLAAVGHDLRRPLTAATAAVSGLRAADVDWSPGDR